MQTHHKKHVQDGLDWATSHIQNIVESSEELHTKAMHIEWQLLMLLDDVVLALPKAMREQAQMCLTLYERIKKAHLAEIDARLAERKAQQKTSPECLPASDSL